MIAEAKASPWFQAVMVTPPIICGVHLRPFSIGHEMILGELGNPYAIGGVPTDQDLLMALQICSRTMGQCRELLSGAPVGLSRWARKWTRYGLATAHKSFRAYLDNYGNLPALVQSGGGPTRHLDASPYWHMARLLCEHYGETLATVWDVAKPMAICAVDCWAESQGTATVASDGEQAVLELARDVQAAIDRGDDALAREMFDKAAALAERLKERK